MTKVYKIWIKVLVVCLFVLFVLPYVFSASRIKNLDNVLWLDATHRFDELGRKLAKKVKKETKQEYAKRKRIRMPEVKKYKIGDREKFWTSNLVTNSFEQIEAELKAIGKHCYVFVSVDQNISDATIAKLVDEFDNKIYPSNTSIFGSEWKPGIDGDERIFLLMFDIKDGFSPSTSGGVVSGGFVAGYFFPADEFLQSQIPENIPVKSNEKEILYLDTYPADPESNFYYTIIAHEFQHMIHFNNDPYEYTWLNEGCSQMAPYFCGYGHANQILAYIKYPDNSLIAWSREHEVANYGQVYLWNFYIINKLLNSTEVCQKFFKDLVSDKKRGAESYNDLFKKYNLNSFDQIYNDFAITNFVNNKYLDNGKYSYDDPILSKLKIPVSGIISEFPKSFTDKVYIWSTDGIKIDLSKAKSTIKINFKGQRIKFDENTYSSYNVTIVKLSTINPTKVELKNMQLSPSMDGAIVIKNDKAYNQLLVLVSAQAPLSVPDNLLANLPGVSYNLEVSDEGLVLVSRHNQNISLAQFTETLGTINFYITAEKAVSGLQILSKKTSPLLEDNIAMLNSEIINTIKILLENKAYNKVRDAIEIIAKNSKIYNGVDNSVINNVLDVLKFYKMQDNSVEIESLINIVNSIQ